MTAATSADHERGIIVFVGPSLRQADLAELQGLAATRGRALEIRPPVCRYDLLPLTDCDENRQVLILDGEFGQSLAVSITEIRTVLVAGQPLDGASSMGALRAVECRTLGMTGSGWVYHQYLTGAIESDADVALMYDPEDFTPVTIPLVNLRWLLAAHIAAGTLSEEDSSAALRVARSLHFRDRRASMLKRRWKQELPASASEVLAADLADERKDAWDRKRLDAIDAVRTTIGAERGGGFR